MKSLNNSFRKLPLVIFPPVDLQMHSDVVKRRLLALHDELQEKIRWTCVFALEREIHDTLNFYFPRNY